VKPYVSDHMNSDSTGEERKDWEGCTIDGTSSLVVDVGGHVLSLLNVGLLAGLGAHGLVHGVGELLSGRFVTL